MSSLITSLKAEIARVARKELKDELQSLRKLTTGHRSEIAALKRQMKSLASQVKSAQRITKSVAQKPLQFDDAVEPSTIRFTAERFASLRAKLGLTKVEMAKLLGASSLSVHKWEAGGVQPRAAQLEKIASVMKLGKRKARALVSDAG